MNYGGGLAYLSLITSNYSEWESFENFKIYIICDETLLRSQEGKESINIGKNQRRAKALEKTEVIIIISSY